MKIAVVGTSNSILVNGYFPIYQALEYPNQVDNLSLGGANCQLIPFSIEKYKIFENYDFLITDCAVNDGDYGNAKFYSSDWLYNELYTIMSQIKEAPIRHLHLIFPSNIPYQEHHKIHSQVCQELNIPYLDIKKLLSESRELGQKEFFQDQNHIVSFLAKQMAWLIKKEREQISSAPKSEDLSACYQAKKYVLYSLPDKLKGKYPICTKSSSLISDDYIVFKDTDTLTLDNFPQSNLESISFWANTKAGYFTLESENHKQNFNLCIGDAHYTYFRPLDYKAFPVNKFLKLQLGLDPNYPIPKREFTIEPFIKKNNELILNSFLFSQEIKAPLHWQPKTLPENSSHYLTEFQKIYTFCTAVSNYSSKNLSYISDDFLFIAASLYPENSTLRRQYLKRIRKTDNPYFVYFYVKLYLLPRKKYSMAIKYLNTLLKHKKIKQAVSDLAHCYIQLKQFDNALNVINTLSENENLITKQHLLCSLYAHMNKPDLFFAESKKLLALNEHAVTILTLVEYCILLGEYQTALQCLEMIYKDPRNFLNKSQEKKIIEKMYEVQAHLNNE